MNRAHAFLGAALRGALRAAFFPPFLAAAFLARGFLTRGAFAAFAAAGFAALAKVKLGKVGRWNYAA